MVVADSGPPLSPEALEQIFDPWYTAEGRRGAGLRLAMCREFVRLGGGRLEAANRAEGGACFTVTLPAAASG